MQHLEQTGRGLQPSAAPQKAEPRNTHQLVVPRQMAPVNAPVSPHSPRGGPDWRAASSTRQHPLAAPWLVPGSCTGAKATHQPKVPGPVAPCAGTRQQQPRAHLMLVGSRSSPVVWSTSLREHWILGPLPVPSSGMTSTTCDMRAGQGEHQRRHRHTHLCHISLHQAETSR